MMIFKMRFGIEKRKPGYFMNCCREITKMGVLPSALGCWVRGVPEWYVAGADTLGR